MIEIVRALIEGKTGEKVRILEGDILIEDLDINDELICMETDGNIVKDAVISKKDFFYNECLHKSFSIYDKDVVKLIVENYKNNKEWVGLVYRKNRNFASNNPRPIPEAIELLLKLRGE